MENSDIINVVFLYVINVIFMITGIFLNSAVIISLWRSRQLRKKICYFMILLLSCLDLAVVVITHPSVITSTISFSLHEVGQIRRLTLQSTYGILYSSSLSALFILNVERLLALTCPFFHRRTVTKTRLVCCQALFTIVVIVSILSPVLYFKTKTVPHLAIVVFLLLFLLLFVYTNYKMLEIAKSKREDERAISLKTSTLLNDKRKKWILNFKNISTCSLAVGCFFVCSCPQLVYSALRLASETPFHDRKFLLFSLWSRTFISINSTLNCLIFFWRNSILRREGMKIINSVRHSLLT